MSIGLVWFRRDLRDVDHAALSAAVASHERVYCVFVFDPAILDPLPREDRRVAFIRESLLELDAALRARGGGLIVRHGLPAHEIPALARRLGARALHFNRDAEPAARARDAAVADAMRRVATTVVSSHKDHVIREGDELRTQGGKPYAVFTPYHRAWLARLTPEDVAPWPVEPSARLAPPPAGLDAGVPMLADIGFAPTDLLRIGMPTGMSGGRQLLADFARRIDQYAELRDFPARKGPSYLSTHLRFGTISIREAARLALAHPGTGGQTWLAELVWREFYHALLWHFPQVAETAFKPWARHIRWLDAPRHLEAWQNGRTGYPLVDAGMRQLRASGWMHNRLRMVTASFLCKHLGVDWRHGEAWFARWLLDFDLAANNGGWQWSASTGCDAQPWFRIFNPLSQAEKFDPQGQFIRRYVPELAGVADKYIHAPWRMPDDVQTAAGVRIGVDYPAPIVDHAAAREAALARYREASAS